MRARLRAIVATTIAFLALSLLIIASACGDDDSGPPSSVSASATATPTTKPTPDAELFPYFQELDAIFQRASDDSVNADTALGDALAAAQDFEATRSAWAAFLTTSQGVFQTAIVAMNSLQPSPAAQPGHVAFLGAAESSRDLAAELLADIAAVTTQAQLDALLDNFADQSGPILDEADAACVQLQDTAITHGLDIDLACTGA